MYRDLMLKRDHSRVVAVQFENRAQNPHRLASCCPEQRGAVEKCDAGVGLIPVSGGIVRPIGSKGRPGDGRRIGL